jgi:UDP-2-acetamido-2-deoxy-ribo-hexuluronate aminotransferase
VADTYDAAFANHPSMQTPFRSSNAHHVFHQYTLKLNGINRDEVQEKLKAIGIPSMVYYPIPAHKQKMFEAFGLSNTDLTLTETLTQQVISLPIHTEMKEEEQTFIINQFLEIINSYTA